MIKEKINSMVFDFGNVVLTDDDFGLVNDSVKLVKRFGVRTKDLQNGWDAAWPDLKIGKIMEDEFMDIFIENAKLPKGETTKLILKNSYREKANVLPTFFLLEKLKQKYKLFALTNSGKEWIEFKERKFHLGRYFRKIINSAVEGVSKPDREIFKRLIKKTEIEPSRSLFIDDRENNVQVVLDLGFEAIKFENHLQLIERLKKYGVET